jgi:hypothetical protein
MARVCVFIAALAVAGCAGGSWPQTTCPQTEVQEYLACGCGCCGGAEPMVMCIEDTGRCLSEIIAEDQAMPGQLRCATAGCALGVRYVRCQNPPG